MCIAGYCLNVSFNVLKTDFHKKLVYFVHILSLHTSKAHDSICQSMSLLQYPWSLTTKLGTFGGINDALSGIRNKVTNPYNICMHF